MKKLLTFAGVSALALITAAPDAFAAAGRFDPTCAVNNLIPINITPLTVSSGKTASLGTPITLYYNVVNNKWYKDNTGSTAITKLSDAGISIQDLGAVKIGDIDATNGALPYVITLSGKKVSEVTNDMLTGTSQCGTGSSTMFGDYDFGLGSTLPSLQGVTFVEDEDGDSLMVSELNFFVRYAAKCVTTATSHATCNLRVTGRQAIYTNSCESGYSGGNWNNSNLYCEPYAFVGPEVEANESIEM